MIGYGSLSESKDFLASSWMDSKSKLS